MLEDIVTIKNLEEIYEKEITKNVRNKKNLYKFDLYKYQYLINIKNVLLNKSYDGGKYNLFVIKEPKVRLIMSQRIYDKIINHFISRHILEPKLTKFLDIRNTATRKGMGTSYAIKMFKKYIEENKKYDNIYFLKMDIKKYFPSIDHNVLKELIKPHLTLDEFDLVSTVIDSTNKKYINETIKKLKQKYNYDLPENKFGKGLPIGNLSSQFLAIYFLSGLHHHIIHNLKLKYMVSYMDDFIIIHHDKEYLKLALKKIETKLNREYKLELNKNKTFIKKASEGVEFLGYIFKVINKKTIIKLNQKNKIKIRRQIKNMKKNNVEFNLIFSKLMNYKYGYQFLQNNYIKYEISKYW